MADAVCPSQNLTEKQKRYQKKKLAKQKVLRKAKKAAAPKPKPSMAEPLEQSEPLGTPLQDVAEPNGTAASLQITDKESKKRKRKAERTTEPTEAEAEQALAAAAEQMEGLNDNQKEMLKRAKKAMKIAKRSKKVVTLEEEQEPVASTSRSPSPLVPDGALPAFPTPRGPAAPNPLLLSAQGLPEALKSAALIDEAFRIPVRDLRVKSRKGKEKEIQHGLDEGLLGRLKEAGVDEFFAGEFCIYAGSSTGIYSICPFSPSGAATRTAGPTAGTPPQRGPARLPDFRANWIRQNPGVCCASGQGATGQPTSRNPPTADFELRLVDLAAAHSDSTPGAHHLANA